MKFLAFIGKESSAAYDYAEGGLVLIAETRYLSKKEFFDMLFIRVPNLDQDLAPPSPIVLFNDEYVMPPKP